LGKKYEIILKKGKRKERKKKMGGNRRNWTISTYWTGVNKNWII
jgi:hypothetical protein